MRSRQLEYAFKGLRKTLSRPLAGHARLVALADFLQQYSPLGGQIDSYRLELLDFVPGLVEGTDLASCDPEGLEEMYRLLESQLAPSFEELDPEVVRSIRLIAVDAVRIYRRLGALNRASSLEQSIGAVSRSDDPVRPTPFSVRVPVVDHSYEGGRGFGLMPGLETTGFRRSTSTSDHVSVAGPYLASDDSFAPAFAAARRTAAIGAAHSFEGRVRFNSLEGIVYGTSSSLGVGIVAACAFAAAAGTRAFLVPCPNLAATGVLLEDGSVTSVDDASLAIKTRAAFFADIDRLVVPAGQLDLARNEVRRLQEAYPLRELPVHGIAKLEDVLSDRRLTQIQSTPLQRHIRNRLAGTGSSFTVVALTIAVAALGLRLTLGPVDQNPARLVLGPTGYSVQNERGATIDEIPLPAENIAALSVESSLYEKAILHDVDLDGQNEVIWSVDDRPNVSRVYLRNYADRTKDWQAPVVFPVRFPDDPQIVSNHYVVLHMAIADLDNDGKLDLVVNTRHETYYPTVVALLDPNNGTIQEAGGKPRMFVHSGHFYSMEVADYDRDGALEVVLGGVNQSRSLAAVAALEGDDFWGQGPSEGYRVAADFRVNRDIAYTLIPRTEVGLSYAGEYNHVTALSWSETRGLLIVQVDDNNRLFVAHPGSEGVQPKLFYSLDSTLTSVAVGTSDQYDTVRRIQRERGVVE